MAPDPQLPPNPPDRIRAFVAACLPPDLLRKIQRQQQELAQASDADAVRWTKAEQLHLTLKFYGSVLKGDLAVLESGLERAAAGIRPVHLTAAGLGCFPSAQKPNVLWVGLGGELAELEKLQKRIEAETAAFGSHSESREFHPHLTIGRVKTPGPPARRLGELIRSMPANQLGEWTVSSLTLMESRLSPRGSIYTPLREVQLGS